MIPFCIICGSHSSVEEDSSLLVYYSEMIGKCYWCFSAACCPHLKVNVSLSFFFLMYLLACSITLVLVILHAIYIWYYNNCFFVTISLFCVCPSVYSSLDWILAEMRFSMPVQTSRKVHPHPSSAEVRNGLELYKLHTFPSLLFFHRPFLCDAIQQGCQLAALEESICIPRTPE